MLSPVVEEPLCRGQGLWIGRGSACGMPCSKWGIAVRAGPGMQQSSFVMDVQAAPDRNHPSAASSTRRRAHDDPATDFFASLSLSTILPRSYARALATPDCSRSRHL